MTRPIVHYPFTPHTISQPFGEDNTNHPERAAFYIIFDNRHSGVDFPVPIGTPVTSSFHGIVVRKEFHKGMGNVVGVRNGNIVVLYAHLSQIEVNLGQIVKSVSKIGLSGDTGNACLVPHLHFELRDLTKPTLKEMVFEPLFDQPLNNWEETFTYTVNNTNTPKTLQFLAERYFGDSSYWVQISKKNSHISSSKDAVIPTGTKVVIPNIEA